MKHKAYFRFYEELNDFLPADKKKIRFDHIFTSRASVKDMIESIGVPHTEIDLILVNKKSVNFSYIVKNKDDISVYPVFESFDITDTQRLRPKPLRIPKFILDVHLGKLARYLRMLGIDSAYRFNYSKEEIVKISYDEKRAILTKDRHLLKRNEVTHGYWIRSGNPEAQVKEVIQRFELLREIKLLTRCLICNQLLNRVNKEEIENNLPPKVKEYHSTFLKCPECERIYWKGSHYLKMKLFLDSFIRADDK